MKQFFYAVLLLGFLAVSCTKEDLVAPSDNSSQLSENEGLKDFAVILSRAVKNEPQLRDFLKEEALLEFDNDYDVGNAYCSFSFIPIDIRNEYEITQCLRNRKPAQS